MVINLLLISRPLDLINNCRIVALSVICMLSDKPDFETNSFVPRVNILYWVRTN